jgi:hypothetical protein
MVRRRCRFIIVSDAGCDPHFAFDDLGNAVRKIKLDLGITIRFHGLSELKTRSEDNAVDPRTRYYAIGEIDYPAADRDSDRDEIEKGVILYLKPAYHGTEVVDIGSYATAHRDFPHQSTVDQWFSESQFESYRALGFHIADEVLGQTLARYGYPAAPTVEQMLKALAAITAKVEEPRRRRRRRPPEPGAAERGAAEEGTGDQSE